MNIIVFLAIIVLLHILGLSIGWSIVGAILGIITWPFILGLIVLLGTMFWAGIIAFVGLIAIAGERIAYLFSK